MKIENVEAKLIAYERDASCGARKYLQRYTQLYMTKSNWISEHQALWKLPIVLTATFVELCTKESVFHSLCPTFHRNPVSDRHRGPVKHAITGNDLSISFFARVRFSLIIFEQCTVYCWKTPSIVSTAYCSNSQNAPMLLHDFKLAPLWISVRKCTDSNGKPLVFPGFFCSQ